MPKAMTFLPALFPLLCVAAAAGAEPEPRPPPPDQDAGRPAPADRPPATGSTFTPSERITADSVVSLPVDI